MYKFKVGDIIKINCQGRSIPVDTLGVVVVRFNHIEGLNWYDLSILGIQDLIRYRESELEHTIERKTKESAQARQKFQIGNVVRTYNTRVIDTIISVKDTDHNGFLYTLAGYPGFDIRESQLELVQTSFNNEVSPVSLDLEKRVSKTRDDLLRNVFN